MQAKVKRKTIKRVPLLKIISQQKDFHPGNDAGLAKYKYLKNLTKKGQLEPIKSSGHIGGEYDFYEKYRIVEHITDEWQQNFDDLNSRAMKVGLSLEKYLLPSNRRELQTEKNSKNWFIDNYWHQDFEKDKSNLVKIINFMTNKKELLKRPVSVNERSFQIFGQEKVFEKQNGQTLLKRLGINYDSLNTYNTFEFPNIKEVNPTGINVMIENEDPMFDLVYAKHPKVHEVIYSGGQSLIASLKNPLVHDFDNEDNLYYWGDLDGIGISMFLNVQKLLPGINPWVEMYEKMLDKADNLTLPKPKNGNSFNKKELEEFKAYFPSTYQDKLDNLNEQQTYIPQEIVTIHDY